MVVGQNGSVEEVNHYYPFGGTFRLHLSSLTSTTVRNWIDKVVLTGMIMGPRHYDVALGRWHVVDPMARDIICGLRMRIAWEIR